MTVRLRLVVAVMMKDVSEVLGVVPDLADEVEDTHKDLVQMPVLHDVTMLHHDPLKAGPDNSHAALVKMKVVAHFVKSNFSKIVNLQNNISTFLLDLYPND